MTSSSSSPLAILNSLFVSRPVTAAALLTTAVLLLILYRSVVALYRCLRPYHTASLYTGSSPFHPAAMSRVLYRHTLPFRAKMFETLQHRLFDPDRAVDLALSQQRELARSRLQLVCDSGLISVTDLDRDPLAFFEAHEIGAVIDASMATKMTVQFNLFGGTLLRLGTDRHQDMMDDVDSAQAMGCFALTERGYGNNAVCMKSTATWDGPSQSFIIHTPTPEATKVWITNGAIHASWAVVFANMIIDGDEKGVHAFLTRIRDDSGTPCRGVTIRDMGEKMGCNGVDNAELSFDNVRVPLANLLDRFSQVSPEGHFSSAIEGKRKRFLAVADQLLSGRLCLSSFGLGGAKLGLAVAVAYSARRLCFGPSGQSDFPILSYHSQLRSLMPRVAQVYAMQAGLDYARLRYAAQYSDGSTRGVDESSSSSSSSSSSPAPPLVATICAVKSYVTWAAVEIGNVVRERCGGQGYLKHNLLATLAADAHASVTAEGDNVVLAQKTCRDLVFKLGLQTRKEGLPMTFLKTAAARAAYRVRRLIGMDVRSMKAQLAAFREREQRLSFRLALLLGSTRGPDQFKTWNSQMNLVLAVCRAFSERLMLEQFHARIKTVDDESLVQPLRRLASLYALWCMENDMPWFLSTNTLSSRDAPIIQAEIDALCTELRDDAESLVAAFDLPEQIVTAPIATSGLGLGKNMQ